MDLVLGMQTGIRPRVTAWTGGFGAVVVEGFYGALLTRLGASEGAGGGGRWLFRRAGRAGCDCVIFGPGVDVLCQFRNDGLTLIAPTVDFGWWHAIGEHSACELGINAGVGIGVSGQRSNGRDAAGQATPLISVYGGLRF
jgi:hypothetical protein